MSFVDPKEVIRILPDPPKGTIADFGCGAGYFSTAFSQAVGDHGTVIAIDVLPSALEAVQSKIKTEGLRNIVTKRANLERENGSGLDASSVDWVVAKDIFFQNRKRDVLVREIFRVLRPGGHAIVMEWNPSVPGTVGPDAGIRVSADELRSLVRDAGFSEIGDLPVGAFHYAFYLTK